MNIREMTLADIPAVLPLYLSYYNGQEGGCWTAETAGRRIHQVLSMEGSYSLLMEEEHSRERPQILGFAMGYFKQYDDITGYTLEEILISGQHQRKGLGSALLKDLERRVREMGASCVELQAVNDPQHEAYYGKAGYKDARNFVLKVKWFQ